MPTIVPKRRSSFGTDCIRCGNELIAPERSEYWDERRVLHLWRCAKCDHSFEVIWSADTRLAAHTKSSHRGVYRYVPFRREVFAHPSTRITKSAIATLIVTIVTAGMLTESCHAQATSGGGSGGGRKQHQQKTDKPAAQTPKADEKAYNAALKSLPDKPFDPWRGAR
jgi:hypothetical protein